MYTHCIQGIVICIINVLILGFIQRKYWALKCWTEFELWIYEGREFQTENTNVFRYIFKWGFGVYTWKLDDERMYIRHKSKRRSKIFRRISTNSFKHLNSFHIYNPFGEWHPFKIRKHCRWWGVKITIKNYLGILFWSLTSFSSR